MNRRFIGSIALIVAIVLSASSQSNLITAEDLKAHVKYLASDELEGRGSGTEGNRKAAAYIADLMKTYALKPAGDNGTYFQKFEFVSAVKQGKNNALTIEGPNAGTAPLAVDVDFRPFGFSSTASVAGPLVFAGYGISAPSNNYDDYKDVDVTGKIVAILRYNPDGNDTKSPFYRLSSPRDKARVAREKGALGVIMVTGPADDSEDELVKLSFDQSSANSGIPVVSMKRSLLEPFFKARGLELKSIQDSIKAAKKPFAVSFAGVTVSMKTDVEKIMASTANIAGFLEGPDPALKDEVIIVGAHMDHLGYGGPGSGSMLPDTVAIHHGADDNASGTAALLDLIKAFSGRRNELKRSILFLSFSGEELGTLGSAFYVNHPYVPFSRTEAMVNLDMVGKLRNKALTVGGTGTSPAWNELLRNYNPDSTFTLNMQPDGFGPSDHSQFSGKDIPVLFFFTNVHEDYHKPSDTWDKLNYTGEEQIVRYVYNIVDDIDRKDETIAFVKVQPPAQMGGGDGRGFSVTLGIVPDMGSSDAGMKVSSVRPNGNAERAGLRAGDLIVKMAGKKVLNIYDYTGILGELKVGDEIEVEVIRDGQPLTLKAKMEKRK